MATKLLSLLTTLLVSFKFGEPAAMMSISNDKNSLLHTATIAKGDLLGFAYDDASGGVSVANCTATDKSGLTVNSDCTITATSGVTVSAANEGAESSIADFPTTGNTVNMMVGGVTTNAVVSTLASGIDGSTNLLTVTTITGASVSTTASTFLCNALTATVSGGYFQANTGSSDIGKIQGKAGQGSSFAPVMKCVAFTRSGTNTVTGVGTFVLIVVDHADILARYQLFTSPSVVVFLPSISNSTTTTTKVGYIHGTAKCSTTNANLTFDATAQCKGAFTLKAAIGNNPYINFVYEDRNYYLTVSNATCASTTTTTTSTTTCDDSFAFRFKYSKTLIAFLLVSIFTILKSN